MKRSKDVVSDLDRLIAEAEEQLTRLRARLDALREARALHTEQRTEPSEPRLVGTERPGQPRPGDAIASYLRASPGATLDEVVAGLKGNIRTKASDEERLIRNTIWNMLKQQRIRKDENGGLFMNERAPLAVQRERGSRSLGG